MIKTLNISLIDTAADAARAGGLLCGCGDGPGVAQVSPMGLHEIVRRALRWTRQGHES